MSPGQKSSTILLQIEHREKREKRETVTNESTAAESDQGGFRRTLFVPAAYRSSHETFIFIAQFHETHLSQWTFTLLKLELMLLQLFHVRYLYQ